MQRMLSLLDRTLSGKLFIQNNDFAAVAVWKFCIYEKNHRLFKIIDSKSQVTRKRMFECSF